MVFASDLHIHRGRALSCPESQQSAPQRHPIAPLLFSSSIAQSKLDDTREDAPSQQGTGCLTRSGMLQ